MTEGGFEERAVVLWYRRSGGLFHGEVAQGRGAETTVEPHS